MNSSHESKYNMSPRSFVLSVLPATFAMCQFAPDAPLPAWCDTLPFCSISRTTDELSVICAEHVVPDSVSASRDWRAFKVQGPFSLKEVGVLAGLARPLAEASISIMAVSTYDTDYILVHGPTLPAAIAALERAGHQVVQASA